MKKTIIRDKVLLWAVVVYMIYIPVNMFIMLNYGNKLSVSSVSRLYSYLVIIISTIIFIFLGTNLKRIVAHVVIKGDTLYYGFTKSKIINLNALKKIKYTDKIELYSKGYNLKIDVLSLENNAEKYNKILDCIDKKTKLKVDTKSALKSIGKNKEVKYKDISLRFKGLLKWIVVYLSFGVVADGALILMWIFAREYLLEKNMYVFHFISAILLLSFGLYMLIYLFSRQVKAVSIIKVYIWMSQIIGFCVAILTLVFIKHSILISDYLNLILRQIFAIIPPIILSRYLVLSYKVKNTFVNTRLFVKHPRMVKEKVSLLGTTKRKIIALVLAGLTLFVGVKVIKYYSIRDTRTYHSVQEIIDRKYKKKDVDYININDYYYFFIKDKDEWVDEELVFKNNDDYVYVNELNKETRDYRYRSHFIDDEVEYSYRMVLRVYIHRDKYITLVDIAREREEQQAKIYDNYGEIDRITVLGHDYCYFILDKEQLVEDYELNISYGDEIIFTATQEDFMYIHPRERENDYGEEK